MRYEWRLLDAGPLALDGGSMFGVVPKVLWQKQVPADESNRITLGHNCLWLTPEDGGAPVVIETGSGDKFDAKNKAIFGLTDRSIVSAMAEAGLDPADVAHVIVTHLHFDHAGGLTRLPRMGEVPDWVGPDGSGVKLTFPNARVHVQRREWEDAIDNRSVMSRTYLRENLLPVESRLTLWETELERSAEILPGIEAFRVPGHTWGQQALLFRDTKRRDVVFVPDVMPTVHHVGRAFSMAYDVEPYTTALTKQQLLSDAAEHGFLLVLDHEPRTPVVTVEPDGKGWYKLVAAAASR